MPFPVARRLREYKQLLKRKGERSVLLKLEKIGKIYDSNDILTVGIRGIDLAFDYNEFVRIEG